jgi:carbamate kinase
VTDIDASGGAGSDISDPSAASDADRSTSVPRTAPAATASPERWAHRILVALGGNAMSAPDGSATEADQIAALGTAAEHIAGLVAAGFEVVVTHGNGPQVGNLLVKNELTATVVPPVSLDWCGANTQATVGFVLQNALAGALSRRGAERPTATLVTRTLVDAKDPAFAHPDKPVGRFRSRAEAEPMIATGQDWRDFGEKGWRRVVPSPQPLQVLDAGTGRQLADLGYVVICSGGGGIPVMQTDTGLAGVEAVIDKDRAAAILAPDLNADTLVIATDVPAAVVGYGTPDARPLGHVSLAEMRSYAAAGHFGAGSMGPKVEAACAFVAGGGHAALITNLERLADAVTSPLGAVGTVVTATGPNP